jgi:hypothetical protein
MTTKIKGGRIVTPGVVALSCEAQVALEEGDPVHVTGPYEVSKADGTKLVLGITAVPNKGRVGSNFPAAITPGACTIEAFGFLVATVKAGAQIDAGEPVGVAPGGLWVPRGSTGITAGTNEVQTATEGGSGLTSFTLTFDGQTTAAIAAAATAAAVQTALEALNNIDPGDVVVTGSAGGPYTITFGGRYSATNVPQITATPTGGTGTVTMATGTAGVMAVPSALVNGIALTTAAGIDAYFDVLCR